MTNFLTIVGALSLLAGTGAAGYWVGRRHERAAQRAHAERMSRIEGRHYHEGDPHNFDATTARVTKGRIRNRRTWTNQR